MKIGIDCRLWNESGVGRYIRNLIKHLQVIDKSNEYVLFVQSKDIDEVRSKKLEVRSWKIIPTDIRWHTIEEQLKLPSILSKENLDLVHFSYFSVPIFYPGKFIVTIHDLIINQFDTGKASTLPLPFYKIKRLGYKIILKKTVNKALKIIAVSESTKKDVVKFLGVDAEKIVVTYEGVDEEISNLKSQISNLQLKSKNFFLYVGNAYPHKNLERLLQSLNILIRQLADPSTSLVLVGKEDYFYKRLKEKVKKMNLVNNVIFYGEATDEELSALYKNAKALILPSLMEGFGLPAVEAMSNSCLVICSDIAALREVCGSAAIYFNPYDATDIAQKIEVVYSNDTYHYSDKVGKGERRAKEFSWEKMAKETLKIYESCTGL